MNLQDVLDNPESIASYFDRIDIFGFNGDEITGVMQFIFSLMGRKSRIELKRHIDNDIKAEMKKRFIASHSEWLKTPDEPF
ncbi:MAG: hypothetical protein HY805_01120 [Nitrospirae bacterium]|nr:hypothetical protein [Nitrospirota bacterium]